MMPKDHIMSGLSMFALEVANWDCPQAIEHKAVSLRPLTDLLLKQLTQSERQAQWGEPTGPLDGLEHGGNVDVCRPEEEF